MDKQSYRREYHLSQIPFSARQRCSSATVFSNSDREIPFAGISNESRRQRITRLLRRRRVFMATALSYWAFHLTLMEAITLRADNGVPLGNRIFQLRPRNSIRRNFQLVPETENNMATSTTTCIYDSRSQLLSIPPHPNGSNYPASW
ncbi:hypothetical protein CEXT_494641 [Caerostris extrusa]|uniref:Uncharacterized protein n=1 Tax=Caerostris extrusa TaxID=172846 RepID=A0AAV4X1M2_CAEEX|nr:hypothetical protein CEXT_494641 [Caerostris extrusa]